MAKAKDNSPEEMNVDMQTLTENLRALETENRMLKEQKNVLEAKYEQLSQDAHQQAEKLQSLTDSNNALEQSIETLKNEKAALQSENQSLSTQAPENDEIREKLDKAIENIAELIAERDKWRTKAEGLQANYKALKAEMDNRQEPEQGLILSEFVKQYLYLLTQKLSAKYNKEVTPEQVVEDYIIRYNMTERWTEWFHPFIMTEKDAVDIAHSINPEIQSFKDLKQALHLK